MSFVRCRGQTRLSSKFDLRDMRLECGRVNIKKQLKNTLLLKIRRYTTSQSFKSLDKIIKRHKSMLYRHLTNYLEFRTLTSKTYFYRRTS